jgi:hypothetical protein
MVKVPKNSPLVRAANKQSQTTIGPTSLSKAKELQSDKFATCLDMLKIELNKIAPTNGTGHKNNEENGELIASVLLRNTDNFIGSAPDDYVDGYFDLHFRITEELSRDLQSLILVGGFKLSNGSCRIFTNATMWNNNGTVQLSVRSFLLLIKNSGTKKIAHKIMSAISHMCDYENEEI